MAGFLIVGVLLWLNIDPNRQIAPTSHIEPELVSAAVYLLSPWVPEGDPNQHPD